MSGRLNWERAATRDRERQAESQLNRAATAKQKHFLKQLCDQLGLKYIRPLSMADASSQIADLRAMRDRTKPRPKQRFSRPPQPPATGWPARSDTKSWTTREEFADIEAAMRKRVVSRTRA